MILVKLPVALSGGSSVNTEPDAGEKLATTPSNFSPGNASTVIETGCPGLRRASWVSLKLASMKTSASGTSAAMRWPVCT